MDGMVDIPDAELDEIFATAGGYLAEEWSLIQKVRSAPLRRALTVAHGRLHHYLADQAAARGIPSGPVVMSGGTDKPPRPV
jgi:hypothetical protein